MSLGSIEPPRMAEKASDRTQQLLRATREDGPSSDAMQRMSKRLAAAGALTTAPSELQDPPRSAPRFGALARSIAAMAVAGGLVISWQVTRTISMPPTTAPVATASGERGERGNDERVEPTTQVATQPAIHATDAPEPPTLSVDALPSAGAPAPGGPVRAPKAAPSAENSGSPPPSELELLQRAQVALGRNAARALSIAGEQARAYPSGEYVQEREVIAVEALARLGRSDEASDRARALVERFPRTPYRQRLAIAIGHAP